MNPEKLDQLRDTAAAMVAPGKGILAMDESTPTCTKRFESLGIESTAESRRDYREMLVAAEGLGRYVSGAILYDETLRQETAAGQAFPEFMAAAGIIPGIKVDTGAKDLANRPGEKITEGLDGLRERLAGYVGLGARFAKWRAVITVGPGLPTRGCIEANAHALARYAALCQEAGVVPIVEPEVLIDGDHDLARCDAVSRETLAAVFRELDGQGVALEGVVLKASMVISGLDCGTRASVDEVAAATVSCLRHHVPAAVAGVAFLSGGQGNEEATAHLNAMNRDGGALPWPLTFSYARALQSTAIQAWRGESANVPAAQAALVRRARMNAAAATGSYRPEMEQEAA